MDSNFRFTGKDRRILLKNFETTYFQKEDTELFNTIAGIREHIREASAIDKSDGNFGLIRQSNTFYITFSDINGKLVKDIITNKEWIELLEPHFNVFDHKYKSRRDKILSMVSAAINIANTPKDIIKLTPTILHDNFYLNEFLKEYPEIPLSINQLDIDMFNEDYADTILMLKTEQIKELLLKEEEEENV